MPPRKTPQDRQPPKKSLPPPPADRIRTVEWEGFEYSVDPRRFDSLDLMELLGELDEKPFLIAKVVRYMLGDEQYEQFKKNHGSERQPDRFGSAVRFHVPRRHIGFCVGKLTGLAVLLRSRYEAVEADFLRVYRLDLGRLYEGKLQPRRAARLVSQLPPGSAIYRGDDDDSRVFSMESMLLRALINQQREDKDRIPTMDELGKLQARKQRREDIAAAMAAQLRKPPEGGEKPDG